MTKVFKIILNNQQLINAARTTEALAPTRTAYSPIPNPAISPLPPKPAAKSDDKQPADQAEIETTNIKPKSMWLFK